MSVDFVSKAVESLKRATELDESKEYEEAYQKYMESIEVFMTAIKYEDKNPAKKEMLKSKVRQVLERAEKIKIHLDALENGGNNNADAGGASLKTESTGKGKKKDADDERLQGTLDSTIVRVKPNVRWSQIAGLEGAKEALKEAVIFPIRFPQLFTGSRKPWKGILLYGPPGTGKSYLAKALATESDGTFFSISSSDIMARWLGESERLVRNLFEMARESWKNDGKPAIIFIDEIDSLCSARSDGEHDAMRRIKTEFLVQMQGVGHDETGVLVLGATNIPWSLDSAVRRRFERRIYIPLPDFQARCALFKICLENTPHTLTEADYAELARVTDKYSGSDISILVRNATMECVRSVQLATHFKYVRGPDPKNPEKMTNKRIVPCSPGDAKAFAATAESLSEPEMLMPLPVTMQDFLKAVRTCRPSVSDDDITQHIKFTADFGQEG